MHLLCTYFLAQKPFVVYQRKGTKYFSLTLNPISGLPSGVCREWKRKSFQNFPVELINYRNPKNKAAAEAGAIILIGYLKQKLEEHGYKRITVEDITVGAWLEKFTSIETSPRTGINASKNKPYSPDTLDSYKSYYIPI